MGFYTFLPISQTHNEGHKRIFEGTRIQVGATQQRPEERSQPYLAMAAVQAKQRRAGEARSACLACLLLLSERVMCIYRRMRVREMRSKKGGSL